MSEYAGIDYGLGRSNIDKETGIRYGVISMNSISPESMESFEYEYAGPFCPKCGAENIPASGDVPDDIESADWFDGKDFYCAECEECFWSDACYSDESIGWHFDDDGYKLQDCLDNDIFVLESPFYTFAQFCSPCVPGAGNLDNPYELPDAEKRLLEKPTALPVDLHRCAELAGFAKSYCLGHDWFDHNIAPYPVYRVSDGSLVEPNRGDALHELFETLMQPLWESHRAASLADPHCENRANHPQPYWILSRAQMHLNGETESAGNSTWMFDPEAPGDPVKRG